MWFTSWLQTNREPWGPSGLGRRAMPIEVPNVSVNSTGQVHGYGAAAGDDPDNSSSYCGSQSDVHLSVTNVRDAIVDKDGNAGYG